MPNSTQGKRFKSDAIFTTVTGVVRLDRKVPGEATTWYVATWWGNDWSYDAATRDQSDLINSFENIETALCALEADTQKRLEEHEEVFKNSDLG